MISLVSLEFNSCCKQLRRCEKAFAQTSNLPLESKVQRVRDIVADALQADQSARYNRVIFWRDQGGIEALPGKSRFDQDRAGVDVFSNKSVSVIEKADSVGAAGRSLAARSPGKHPSIFSRSGGKKGARLSRKIS